MSEGHDEGGQGDCLRWSRSDFVLARRAARERWGVPDPLRTEALYQAAKALTDPEASHRDRLAAMKLLLEADRHDQADDRMVLDRAKFEHATRPPETPDDDFTVDLGRPPDDPAHDADRPTA